MWPGRGEAGDGDIRGSSSVFTGNIAKCLELPGCLTSDRRASFCRVGAERDEGLCAAGGGWENSSRPKLKAWRGLPEIVLLASEGVTHELGALWAPLRC